MRSLVCTHRRSGFDSCVSSNCAAHDIWHRSLSYSMRGRQGTVAGVSAHLIFFPHCTRRVGVGTGPFSRTEQKTFQYLGAAPSDAGRTPGARGANSR